MTCTITDKLVTLGADGNTRPMPRGIVYAQPSALPVYLNNQLLSNPVPTTQTDSNGNWTLVLPWQSETTPAALTWQIVLPDGTIYSGTVPAGQSGPFTIYQLVNTYAWAIQAGSLTPSTGGIVTISTTPTATPNYGILNLGPKPFDGATSGFFAGASGGTVLAINGDTSVVNSRFLDVQGSGVSAFFIDRQYNVRCTGQGDFYNSGYAFLMPSPAAGKPTLAIGDSSAYNQGGTPSFQGTAYIGVNSSTSNTTKNLIDLQNQGVSKFQVDPTGALAITPATTSTAPGAGGAGALPATPAGYLTVTINSVARKIPYY